jgi:hypothetical protein
LRLQEASPAGADGRAAHGSSAGLARPIVACGAAGAAGHVARRLGVVAAEVDDTFAEPSVRCEDAVVAVAVDPRRRDETAQGG